MTTRPRNWPPSDGRVSVLPDDYPDGPETVQEAVDALVESCRDLWEVAGLPVAQAAADRLQAGVECWRDWWKPMDLSGPWTAHWPETFIQRLSRLAGDSLRAVWAGVATPFHLTLRAVMIESTKAKAAASGFDLDEEVDARILAGEEPAQAWMNAYLHAQVSKGILWGEGTGPKLQGIRGSFLMEPVDPLAGKLDPADFIRIRPDSGIARRDHDPHFWEGLATPAKAFQDSTTGEWMTDDEDEDR